ncbi:MAG: alpha/beta fold hydrolase [Microbacterium sp.]
MATAEDGARIAWRSEGAGEPLLLIGGQGSDASIWREILPELARRHLVIVFDHRGTGESEAGEDAAYSTRGFARDAVAVLDAAGVGRAHVCGYSMGGRVAQWLGIEHADRVGALVLVATTGGDERGVPRSPEATTAMASGDPERMAPLFFADDAPEAVVDAFLRRRPARHAARLHFAASRAHDAWDRLEEIDAPTLVLHGGDDPVTPPGNGALLADRIPGARLEVRPGARHGFLMSDREEAAPVLAFLREHPLAEA